ncbi:MAG: glycosyltransferase [Candidatus Melainabacteria bacterium]
MSETPPTLRRLLLIAYFFPPLGGVGAQRPVKLIKYLSRLGWQVDVLTVQEDIDYIHDDGFFDDLPTGTRIFRAPCVDTHRLQKTLSRLKPGFVRKLAHQLFSLAMLPDFAWTWWLPGLMKALQLGPYDAVLSTSPPYTAHLIALGLRWLKGVHWVADFRDGWTRNPYQKYPTPVHRWLHARLERAVLRCAGIVTVCTPDIRQQFLVDHPGLEAKIRLITNGYDPEIFTGDQPAPRNQRFVMTYTGSFYGMRSPEYFYQGLQQALDCGALKADQTELRLLGRMGKKYFDYPGLTMAHPGYIPNREAVRHILESDLLLLIEPSAGAYTGKVFDYIGSGRPILAMIPEGSILEPLLLQSPQATIVRFNDPEAIRQAICNAYQAWEQSSAAQIQEKQPLCDWRHAYRRDVTAAQMHETLLSLSH